MDIKRRKVPYILSSFNCLSDIILNNVSPYYSQLPPPPAPHQPQPSAPPAVSSNPHPPGAGAPPPYSQYTIRSHRCVAIYICTILVCYFAVTVVAQSSIRIFSSNVTNFIISYAHLNHNACCISIILVANFYLLVSSVGFGKQDLVKHNRYGI